MAVEVHKVISPAPKLTDIAFAQIGRWIEEFGIRRTHRFSQLVIEAAAVRDRCIIPIRSGAYPRGAIQMLVRRVEVEYGALPDDQHPCAMGLQHLYRPGEVR
jgi:hypothetical protein